MKTIFKKIRSKKMVFISLVYSLTLLFFPHQLFALTAQENKTLDALLGEYQVTFSGCVGGEYQTSNSIVSGSTTGVRNFTTTGTILLAKSEPGVIAVKSEMDISVINPDTHSLKATVIQNPLHVFMGTPNAKGIGDFSVYSMMRFNLRSGSVNLIYFTIKTKERGNDFFIKGTLMDKHTSEAAAANMFAVPIKSPILGSYNDPFLFNTGAMFEIIVSGNKIHGTFKGTGESGAGVVYQTAVFETKFEGFRK